LCAANVFKEGRARAGLRPALSIYALRHSSAAAERVA